MQIEVLEQGEDAVTAELVAGVRRFNKATVGDSGMQPLAVTARDPDGRLLGGVAGKTAYRQFLIDVVWVDDSMRGQGLGAQLMQQAEAVARARGCIAAQVDTLSFQAPGFYQRLGFEIVGTVPDCPAPYARHFLFKRYALQPAAPAPQ